MWEKIRSILYVKKKIAIIAGIILLFLWASGATTGGIVRSARDGRRIREYSEQAGAATARVDDLTGRFTELAIVLGDGLSRLDEGLGRIAGELAADVSDIRQLAVRLRASAEAVQDMENELNSLRYFLSGFWSDYYDALDAEIEWKCDRKNEE